MPKSQLRYVFILVVLTNAGSASAITSSQYGIIQESASFALWLACLVLAVSVFSLLKNGSLGKPWLFLIAGFALASLGSVIQLLDNLKMIFNLYDLRAAVLCLKIGSTLSLFVAMFLYKKGLQ